MKPVISQECLDLLFKYIHKANSISATRCGWGNCPEIGVFDGVNTVFLNAEARKNLRKDRSRFVLLCPHHLKNAMANLNAETDLDSD